MGSPRPVVFGVIAQGWSIAWVLRAGLAHPQGLCCPVILGVGLSRGCYRDLSEFFHVSSVIKTCSVYFVRYRGFRAGPPCSW